MTHRTVALIVLLSLALFVAPPAADTPPAPPPAQIGILSSASGPILGREVFRQSLRELGYVEGRSLTFVERYAGGQLERLAALAAELVALEADVIVTTGHAATRAAQQATRTIPIIMVVGGDPVSAGLVASLARPGGNLTGMTALSPKLSAQRLAWLKGVVPRVTHVAVLFNPDDETKRLDWQQTAVAARAQGVRLHPVEVRGPDSFAEAFAAMRREQVGALITLTDAVTFVHRAQLVSLATEYGLPAIYEGRAFVEAGGLMSYGVSFPEVWRRAATYVDKILKGTKPADLPIEQPTTVELVINLKTARALGLTMPPTLLFQADEMIQ
jgi:putative ABC transport system substrate-binding protein